MTKETTRSAPVSLPAGSYDLAKLSDGLSAATAKEGAEREKAVSAALDEARVGQHKAADMDTAARADQTRVDVHREDLGVTERVLVQDPDSDAAKAAAPAEVKVDQRIADLTTTLTSVNDLEELDRMRKAENRGEKRAGALAAIDARIAEVKAIAPGSAGEGEQ
jgi:hypothetical protein